MNDELKSIWNDLSYTVQKKSDKILKTKSDIDARNKKSIPSALTAVALFGFYIIPNGANYINSVIPVSAFGQIQSRPINFFDIIILLFTVTCSGYLYINT